MAERRTLAVGLMATPTVDPAIAREFVHTGKLPELQPTPSHNADSAPSTAGKSPISTRIRTDYATALKRASLERQLAGLQPNTLQAILEDAIEPWLRTNGYLP